MGMIGLEFRPLTVAIIRGLIIRPQTATISHVVKTQKSTTNRVEMEGAKVKNVKINRPTHLIQREHGGHNRQHWIRWRQQKLTKIVRPLEMTQSVLLLKVHWIQIIHAFVLMI